MSASPRPLTKRPLDEESSPSGPTDQPDAKRPALDKIKTDDSTEEPKIGLDSQNTAEVIVPSTEDKSETEEKATANGHTDTQGDTAVPDAPVVAAVEPATVPDTQPIRSTAGQYDRASSQGPTQQHQDETGWIHIRAVISSAEAATVIGKGGENVSLIRGHSGAKCTVSDYSRGAIERVLTVSGLVDAAAKVCGPPLVSS